MNHRVDACRDAFCDWCETRAEQRKADRDEPLSPSEEAALDDAYERRYGAH